MNASKYLLAFVITLSIMTLLILFDAGIYTFPLVLVALWCISRFMGEVQ